MTSAIIEHWANGRAVTYRHVSHLKNKGQQDCPKYARNGLSGFCSHIQIAQRADHAPVTRQRHTVAWIGLLANLHMSLLLEEDRARCCHLNKPLFLFDCFSLPMGFIEQADHRNLHVLGPVCIFSNNVIPEPETQQYFDSRDS